MIKRKDGLERPSCEDPNDYDVRFYRVRLLRPFRQTCAADGAGTNCNGPRSVDRRSEYLSELEAVRGIMGVAGGSA
jgi:hypothetical protein